MKRMHHFLTSKVRSDLAVILTGLCAGGAAGALVFILGYIVYQGTGAINVPFLTQVPHPIGVSGGGVANGMVGTLIIVGLAAIMAIPVGVLTAIYLALYGRGRLPEVVRFMSDVLSGVPGIAIGLFAYTVLVQPFGRFSAFPRRLRSWS